MSKPEKRIPSSIAPNYATIRVRKPTANRIRSILTKLNRKQYGRKVTATDLINGALAHLDEDQLKQIQQLTFSNQDRLEMEYQKHCKENGRISEDDFLGLLLGSRTNSIRGSEIKS